MKTFKDLEFKPHQTGDGLHAVMLFPNGYGVSVVRFKNSISGTYYSYTSSEKEWELAVIKGGEKDWTLTYETKITKDVIGHLKVRQVTAIMKQVQKLKKEVQMATKKKSKSKKKTSKK